MITLIRAAIIVMASANCWAVATVNLNNYGPSANPIYFLNGALLPVEGAYVELFSIYIENGSGSTIYSEILPATGGGSILTLTEPGYFNAGFGVVYGVPDNGFAKLMLRAWKGSQNYEDSSNWEASVTWSQQVGSWDGKSPLPTGGDLKNPPLIFDIPEPSSLILGLLGGAGLILYRRKTSS